MTAVAKIENTSFKCCPKPELKILGPAACICVLIFGIGMDNGLGWYWVITPSLIVLVIGAAVSWSAVIEPAKGRVREYALLYGKRILKERNLPFTEFAEVFCELRNNESYEFWVCLRHKSGRVILVKQCGAEPRFAEELAWRISCDTGIRLNDQPVSNRFTPSRLHLSAIRRWVRKFRT